jgi:hypothetical protein
LIGNEGRKNRIRRNAHESYKNKQRVSALLKIQITGLSASMSFIDRLNFDTKSDLNLTELYRWMIGEETIYGCIKETV